MSYFGGVDPGKGGGIAFWSGARAELSLFRVPLHQVGERLTPKKNVVPILDYDRPALATLLGERGGIYLPLAIENVTTRPDVVAQTSALTAGIGFGTYLGMLEAFNYAYQIVDATLWKRDLFNPRLVPEAADLQPPPQPSRKLQPQERNRLLNQRQALLKRNACTLAQRLFPAWAPSFAHYTVDDGLAEAALLAYWKAGESGWYWSGGVPR